MSSQMPEFKYKATEAQIHDLMMRVPAYQEALMMQPRSKMRAFIVKCDNSKKRKPSTPFQSYEAEGIVFSSGHVCIDSEYTPQKGYHNIDEMEEDLLKWGKCEIVWIEVL